MKEIILEETEDKEISAIIFFEKGTVAIRTHIYDDCDSPYVDIITVEHILQIAEAIKEMQEVAHDHS